MRRTFAHLLLNFSICNFIYQSRDTFSTILQCGCVCKRQRMHQVSQHCILRFELSMNCLRVTYLGIRCPKIVLVSSHVQALGVQKVLRRHMSGRQVSKPCLGVTCPGVRCPKWSWASSVWALQVWTSGVYQTLGRQVSKSGLGIRCPLSLWASIVQKVGWASRVSASGVHNWALNVQSLWAM